MYSNYQFDCRDFLHFKLILSCQLSFASGCDAWRAWDAHTGKCYNTGTDVDKDSGGGSSCGSFGCGNGVNIGVDVVVGAGCASRK